MSCAKHCDTEDRDRMENTKWGDVLYAFDFIDGQPTTWRSEVSRPTTLQECFERAVNSGIIFC